MGDEVDESETFITDTTPYGEGGSECTVMPSGFIYSEEGERSVRDDDESMFTYSSEIVVEEEHESFPYFEPPLVFEETVIEVIDEKKKKKRKKGKKSGSVTLVTPGTDFSADEEDEVYYDQIRPRKKKSKKKKISKRRKTVTVTTTTTSIPYDDLEEEEEDDWTWESYTPGSSREETIKEILEAEIIADDVGKKKKKDVATKKKGGKKKKKVPPEVLAEMAKQVELAARQAEEEKRLRELAEIENGKAKDQKETMEHALRMEQLHTSLQHIENIVRHNVEAVLREREEIEWIQYQKTDGLPDPYVCKQMNSYLLMWDQEVDYTTMDEAALRTTQVLSLLEDVTSFIETPLGAEKIQIDNWNWILRLSREAQQKSLDMACYRVLRDVGKNMNAIDLEKSEFTRVEPNFTVCLWTMVELPTPQPNPRAPQRARTDLKFPELNLQLVLPVKINCYRLSIRVMYLSYDHLSDTCATFAEPPMPESHRLDLYEITREEWYSKRIYKYEEYVRMKQKDGVEVEPQEYDRKAGTMPDVPFIKMEVTPSAFVVNEEDDRYNFIRKALNGVEVEHVINLRRFIVLGGIFFMNLYFQPPQPQHCVSMEVHISRLFVPRALQEVKFCGHYQPPPPDEGIDEELSVTDLEEKTKKNEAKLDKLIFVAVQLPTHVMWTDTPTVCMWDSGKKAWSTEDVHDYKYLEETASVTFRAKRFGMFSFVMNRFTNLPYQTWEVKPEEDGTVTVQLVAAILVLDFNVKGNRIAIMEVQNAPNESLNDYLGVYYKLPKLKRLLLEVGVDVFPYFDAFCYVENSYEKHWQMEKHLYFQMAQVSACFNFCWSRWNAAAGRRNAVMQMREYKVGKSKQASYSMLSVTPLKAEFIDCTEVSSEFSTETVEGMV
ncbi:hypothetical protein FQR65_LT13344, partial [Abscondita terminalis]